MSNVDFDAFRDRIETLERERVGNGGGPPYVPSMDWLTRLVRVEEAIVGLWHSQNLIVALGAIVAIVMVGFGVYLIQRVDSVNDRVVAEGTAIRKEISGVAGAISIEAAETRKELIGVVTAISSAITAARQPPPANQPPPPSRP